MLTAGIACLVYFIGLGTPALWEPDEGRYAEIPREMVLSGDYVTPRNDWVRYFEKPPLVYWTSAAAMKLLGSTQFAARSQAALASVGSVVVMQILAEAIAGESIGLLAAAALGLSPLFFIFGRFASPDPLLAFFLTAALGAFYFAARGDFRTGASRKLMLLASAMLALGTLAKGPVALVLGGGIALLWMVLDGRVRQVIALRWPECIAIFAVIVVPWFVLAASRNPGFLDFFFVHEHWQRYLENTEHGWGPWFFIPVVVVGMWPFFYFVPSGVQALWNTGSHESDRRRSDLRFLLIWFGLIFAFFSIPRSKLGEYILPGIPPIAILAAIGLQRISSAELTAAKRLLRWFAVISAIPLVAVLIARIWFLPRLALQGTSNALVMSIQGDSRSIATDATLLAVCLALPTAFLLLARLLKWRAVRMDRVCIAAAALVAVVGAKVRIDMPGVSYRELARAIGPRIQSGCALVSYHHFVQSLPFYTGSREILAGFRGELAPFADSPDAAPSFISTDEGLAHDWSAGACVVVIANRSDLTHLETILTPKPVAIGCEGKKFALINRQVP